MNHQALLHGLTILVVDDHSDTVAMFVEYLGLMGARVIGATLAETALVVPVYAMSGERNDTPDAANGFTGYFLKPVELDAVGAVLGALPPATWCRPPEPRSAADVVLVSSFATEAL